MSLTPSIVVTIFDDANLVSVRHFETVPEAEAFAEQAIEEGLGSRCSIEVRAHDYFARDPEDSEERYMTAATVTESRPSDVLANLHASADPEREYLFANRDASQQDLILVATSDDHAVGYIATTEEQSGEVLIWEHVVVPGYRGQGIGRQLLHEVVTRTSPATEIVIDPMGELALERVIDYYRPLGFPSQPEHGRIRALARDVVDALNKGSGLQ